MNLSQLGRQEGYALVLGDLVLDETIKVSDLGVHRSEHVTHMRTAWSECRFGAAANVARGVKAMGWRTLLATSMFAPEQEDEMAVLLDPMAAGGMFITLSRPMRLVARRLRARCATTGKTRFRLDTDPPARFMSPNTVAEHDRSWAAAITRSPDDPIGKASEWSPAVVVVNDHNKGYWNDARRRMLANLFPGVPRVIDPGSANFSEYFRSQSPTVLKFNVYQAAEFLAARSVEEEAIFSGLPRSVVTTVDSLRCEAPLDLSHIPQAHLLAVLGTVWRVVLGYTFPVTCAPSGHAMVMTCGPLGAIMAIPAGPDMRECIAVHAEQTRPRSPLELCDPCGAGDTFLATLATTLALDPSWHGGWTEDEAMAHLRIANTAADLAVRVPGTAVISAMGLQEELAK